MTPVTRRGFSFCAFPPKMRGDARQVARHHGGMTDRQKFQRAYQVFVARLLSAYGPAAPDLLRRTVDELEWMERERLDASRFHQHATPVEERA